MIHVIEGDLLVPPGKVRVPRATAAILPRPRITAMIEESVSQVRVTLVTGPAGAGKTVACQQWAAQTASRAIAWLTVDAGDRQPRRFWTGLLAALDSASARTGRFPPPRPADDGPDSGLTAQAIAAIGQPSTPVTVIIDDVHELAGSPAERELAVLLRQAPDGLTLVLCGRFAPSARLARLRLAADLAEITAADLACTPREISALAGTGRTQLERDRLQERTRGWLAGVLLSAREDEADAYLREQVLDGLSPARRQFLLRTSVAPWLAADLAALLSGDGQAAAVLHELAGRNCLVEETGDGYRYHPMLRRMLRAELDRALPDQVPRLLARAARWYAARGDAEAAASCLAETADWAGVAAVLEEAGLASALTGDLAALEATLRAYPGDPGWTGTPVIAAVLAAARLAAGDPDGAADCLRPASSDDLSVAAVAVMLPSGPDVAAAIELADRTQPRTVAGRRARGALWFALGGAQLRAGRPARARRAFDRAARDLGGLTLGERAVAWLAVCLALSGDLRGADSVLANLPSGIGTAPIARLAGALTALERDDLAAARPLADEVIAAPDSTIPGEPDLVRLALAVTAATEAGPAAGRTAARARDPGPGGAPGPGGNPGPAGVPGPGDAPGPGGELTVRDRIAVLLAAAVAQRRLGQHQAATELLEEALALAEPHDAIRVFLDGGPSAHAAISILVGPRSPVAAFAARILERFAIHVPGEAGLPEQTAQLTESELAVLRLLPSQLTYQEIAAEMFLSVNTVKTHLRLAYRKLGVNSRRTAIAQARRLGLV